MLSDLKTNARIITLFAIMAFSIPIVCVGGYIGMRTLESYINSSVAESKQLEYAQRLRAEINTLRRFEKELYINIGDAAKVEEYKTMWDGAVVDFRSRATALLKMETHAKDKETVQAISKLVDDYLFGFYKVYEQIQTGRITTAQEANRAIKQYKDAIRQSESLANEYSKESDRQVDAEVRATAGASAKIRMAFIALAGCTFVGGSIISFIYWRREKNDLLKINRLYEENLAYQESLEKQVNARTAELRESEKKYRILFMDSPDAYLIIVDGVFVDCNRAAEVMLRGERGQIVGQPPEILSPEFQHDGRKSSESAEEKIKEALNKGKSRFEWTHRRFDGSEFFVEVSIVVIPMRGETALLVTWRDITLRKEAEEIIKNHNQELEQLVIQRTMHLEEANKGLVDANNELERRRLEAEIINGKLQQLSSAVVNSPTSIVITDKSGTIEYVNPKFTEMTGYLPEEAIGRNPRIVKADGVPKEVYEKLWETILAGREWRGDLCNKKKNGGIFWEHASISPIKDEQGVITHFVSIQEDVTEERRIAEELLAAQQAAQSSSVAKSQFLANMSHEIRTPLNAIIGFSDLTLKCNLPPRQHDYIHKIHNAGELLLNIINDILDFSKIEAMQLKMESIKFRLNETFANAHSILQQKAIDKGLRLLVHTSPEIAPCLIGDPHRLSQVITNLLSNAVKFTEHGEVVLEAALLARESDRLQLKFTVRDSGIGISPEQIDKLFHAFSQADNSTTRKFGGTGLGLSISKQLVELMGGVMWCESSPGEGSSFYFTAWFGFCGENGSEHCKHGCSRSREYNDIPFSFAGSVVLLVDDNEINRHLAMEILKETGAEVHSAVNGMEAVAMITDGNTSYDMVLMDIEMPVMDGYDATRLIRSDSRFTDLPIIAMTAHAMEEERQKILNAGMDAHITKPIIARTMLQVIKLFLKEQESTVQLSRKFEKSETETVAIPEILGIDAVAALSRLDGDRNLYLWLLQQFFENQANAAQLITEALDVGDIKLAARRAHTNKGIAGSIGAVKLEELASVLEEAIGGESDADADAALGRFATELGRLVAELKIELPLVSSGEEYQSGTLDAALVTPILGALLDYIKSRDGRAERYLDDYQRELSGLPHADVIQIKKLLQNFNYQEAGEAVQALAAKIGIHFSQKKGG